MARLPQLAVFSFAALHLLLFSICPVSSSRIYRTSDAVVMEVDDVRPSIFANRYSGNPPALIPMTYAVNPYTGLYYHQQPNFPFWPYPLYQPASSISDHVENATATSPDSRQQNIACGKGPDALPQRKNPTVGIIGGSNAEKNSWPFIVGLWTDGAPTVDCGGSIISQTRILTAAHCVDRMSADTISKMTVSLGMHDQRVNDAHQTRRVTRVVYHTDFNRNTWVNDIAILTIDPPIRYSKEISPVCLPPFNNAADQFVDKDAAIIGWGRNINPVPPNVFPYVPILQQATVKIISNGQCSEYYGSLRPNPLRIFRQHICAGADGKDTCSGDSGGPLVVQAEAGSTAWTQVGVTSFGNSCPALSAKPSVYASVALFRNWINTYMRN